MRNFGLPAAVIRMKARVLDREQRAFQLQAHEALENHMKALAAMREEVMTTLELRNPGAVVHLPDTLN